MSNTYYRSTASEGTPAPAGERLRGWFIARMPSDWFAEAPEVTLDREEITVVGVLAPEAGAGSTDA